MVGVCPVASFRPAFCEPRRWFLLFAYEGNPPSQAFWLAVRPLISGALDVWVRQTARRSLISRWGGRYCGADCPGTTRRRRVRDFRETSAKAVGSHCRQSDRVGANGDPSSPGRRLAAEPGCPAPTRKGRAERGPRFGLAQDRRDPIAARSPLALSDGFHGRFAPAPSPCRLLREQGQRCFHRRRPREAASVDADETAGNRTYGRNNRTAASRKEPTGSLGGLWLASDPPALSP